MGVLALDHVNVRSANPAATIAFLRDVLQMRVGAPPGREPSEKGAWIFDEGDRPVVHIGSLETPYPTDEAWPFVASKGTGAIHHVALSCTSFEAMRSRFVTLGLEFHENYVAAVNLRQIFVRDPADIVFELNFTGQ